MSLRGVLAIGIGIACGSACAPTAKVVRLPPPPFTPLLLPAPPEELLGREARVGQDGRVALSARRPGCTVRRERREDASAVTGTYSYRGLAFVEGGVASASGGARVAASQSVDYDVRNAAIVTAQVAGDCGERVVRSVYLGSGRVRFLASSVASIGARAGPVAGAGAQETADTLHAVEFRDAGYAVDVGPGARVEQVLRVDVDLPAAQFADGDAMPITVWTSLPAYVLLATVTADGRAYVVLPGAARPAPRSDGRLDYPGPPERAQGIVSRARLLAGAREAREAAIAWAFLDEAAFREVAPLRASGNDVVVEPLAELEGRVRRAQETYGAARIAAARREYRIAAQGGGHGPAGAPAPVP